MAIIMSVFGHLSLPPGLESTVHPGKKCRHRRQHPQAQQAADDDGDNEPWKLGGCGVEAGAHLLETAGEDSKRTQGEGDTYNAILILIKKGTWIRIVDMDIERMG